MYGLSRRVYFLLFRAGLTEGEKRLPNLVKIRRELETGAIYIRKGFGEKTVRELKEWAGISN